MRTTLSIDDDVLQAIKERARHEKRSAGAVASDLMREHLSGPPRSQKREFVIQDGFAAFAPTGDIVTNEMVDRIREAEGI